MVVVFYAPPTASTAAMVAVRHPGTRVSEELPDDEEAPVDSLGRALLKAFFDSETSGISRSTKIAKLVISYYNTMNALLNLSRR